MQKKKSVRRIAILLCAVMVLILAIPMSASAATKTVENGTYYLVSKLNASYVVDVKGVSTSDGANVQLYTKNNGLNQQFTITYQSNGYYTISPKHSGKRIDIQDKSTKAGANVHQWKITGGTNQDWYIEPVGDGYYYIRSRISNHWLSVAGGGAANGRNILMSSSAATDAQKFKLVSTTGAPVVAAPVLKTASVSATVNTVSVSSTSSYVQATGSAMTVAGVAATFDQIVGFARELAYAQAAFIAANPGPINIDQALENYPDYISGAGIPTYGTVFNPVTGSYDVLIGEDGKPIMSSDWSTYDPTGGGAGWNSGYITISGQAMSGNYGSSTIPSQFAPKVVPVGGSVLAGLLNMVGGGGYQLVSDNNGYTYARFTFNVPESAKNVKVTAGDPKNNYNITQNRANATTVNVEFLCTSASIKKATATITYEYYG